MQEVGDEFQKAEATGQDDELVLATQFVEEILLIGLNGSADRNEEACCPLTRGRESFTGGAALFSELIERNTSQGCRQVGRHLAYHADGLVSSVTYTYGTAQ